MSTTSLSPIALILTPCAGVERPDTRRNIPCIGVEAEIPTTP